MSELRLGRPLPLTTLEEDDTEGLYLDAGAALQENVLGRKPKDVLPKPVARLEEPAAGPSFAFPSTLIDAPVSVRGTKASTVKENSGPSFAFPSALLDEEAPEPEKPKAKDRGDFGRGFQEAVEQTPALAKGAVGFVGGVGEKAFGEGGIFSGLKKWGLEGYQKGMEEIASRSKETDQITNAWDRAKEGDLGALVDWAQYGLGQLAGNVAETAITAVLGGAAGALVGGAAAPITGAAGAATGAVSKTATKGFVKNLVEGMVEKEAARLAAKEGAEVASEQILAQATKNVAKDIGASSSLAASGIIKETGGIYGDAIEQAKEEGRELDAGDLARIFGAGVAAGLTEAVVDRLGIDVAAGRINIPGGGRVGKAFVGATIGGGVEGGTEAIQTALERFGAGKALTGEDAMNEYINTFALGALGGGTIGAVTGAFRKGQIEKSRLDDILKDAEKEISSDDGRQELFEGMMQDPRMAQVLEANGIESADDPRFQEVAIRAVRRQQLLAEFDEIPTDKERAETRKERGADIQAAFGDTASTGTGIGTGATENVLRRDSVIPNEEERTLEPASPAGIEPVTLPGQDGSSERTLALSPEDIVARGEGYEVMPTFKVEEFTRANRFVSEREAKNLLETLQVGNALEQKLVANDFKTEAQRDKARVAYNETRVAVGAPPTEDWGNVVPIFPDLSGSEFQIRRGKRSKDAGGGTFYFIESRAAENPQPVPTPDDAPEAPEAQPTPPKGAQPGKAPSAPAAAPAVPRTPAAPVVGPTLPPDLAGAKPRYGAGRTGYTLTFESDIDRALYILAQERPSSRDADYRMWVGKVTGMDSRQIDAFATQVKATIKARIAAGKGQDGNLVVTPVFEIPDAAAQTPAVTPTPATPATPAATPAVTPATPTSPVTEKPEAVVPEIKTPDVPKAPNAKTPEEPKVPEAKAAPITVVSEKRLKDEFGNTATEISLSDGSRFSIGRLNSAESMGLPGWHDFGRVGTKTANEGGDQSYLGDTKEQAIAELIRRAAEKPAKAKKATPTSEDVFAESRAVFERMSALRQKNGLPPRSGTTKREQFDKLSEEYDRLVSEYGRLKGQEDKKAKGEKEKADRQSRDPDRKAAIEFWEDEDDGKIAHVPFKDLSPERQARWVKAHYQQKASSELHDELVAEQMADEISMRRPEPREQTARGIESTAATVQDLVASVNRKLERAGEPANFAASRVPIGNLVGRLPGVGLIEKTASLFGKKVVFFKVNEGSPDFFDGAVLPTTSTIFVNVNTSRAHIRIFGHELVHAIRNSDPKTYRKLVQALAPMLDSQGYNAFVSKQKGYGLANDEKILEEAIGDIVGDRFGENEFWQMLADENPSTFKQVARAVLDFIDNFLAKLTGKQSLGSETLVKDLRRARTEIARILSDAGQTKTDARAGTDTAFSQKRLPQIDDLIDVTTTTPQDFHDRVRAAKASNAFGASVDLKSVADYANMRLYVTPDGLAGAALTDDGDIVSVFRHADGKPGSAQKVVRAAIMDGGVRLDCFNTALPRLYAGLGFHAVAKVKFDPNYAPENWDESLYSEYQNGQPDVILMVYAPQSASGPNYVGKRIAELDYLSYDDALASQKRWEEREHGSRETRAKRGADARGELPQGKSATLQGPEATQGRDAGGADGRVAEAGGGGDRRLPLTAPEYRKRPQQPDAVAFTLVHFSNQQNLGGLSGSAYGTGLKGAERERVTAGPVELRNRVYFYTQQSVGKLPRRESGVGPFPYRIHATNIYDPDIPEARTRVMAMRRRLLINGFDRVNAQEAAVVLSGFDGYYDKQMLEGAVVLLDADYVPAQRFDQQGEPGVDFKMKTVDRSTAHLMDMNPEEARASLGLNRKPTRSGPNSNGVREIAVALNEATLRDHGAISGKDTSKESANKLAAAMVDEIETHLKRQAKTGSGLGWYSENYPNAVKRLSRVFPELGTSKAARDAFTAIVAVTSNGEKVTVNITNAIKIYSEFRNGGSMADAGVGSRRASALTNNLTILQSLVDQFGVEGASERLMTEMTVAEINAELRRNGQKPNSQYTADTVMPRAALYFGPKLGAFYANLMGAEGYLTMDLWWSRTVNRMRGILITQPTQSSIDRFRQMLGLPEDTDSEDVVAHAIPYWFEYKEKNYKNGTEIEKAANTIVKAAFIELEEAPLRASDRKFQYEAARTAQSMLRDKGVNLSIADIQAALWYYEKRLYAMLGGKQAQDIGYEEAILQHAESDRPAGPSSRFGGGGGQGAQSGRTGQEADRDVRAQGQDQQAGADGEVAFSRKQTETPEFKRWFQDSKIVDQNGDPLVVYHATRRDFSEFDPSGVGAFGRGIYLSAFPDRLKQYWGGYEKNATGGNIMPVYVRLKNPANLQSVFDMGPLTDKESRDKYTALQQRLIKAGHDGAVSWLDGKPWEIVVFDPNQIKSAVGNRGTFSLEDDDITFSRKQTETPEFKAWFGDSKVVDAEGRPLVVYHGTRDDFSAFDAGSIGKNFRDSDGGFFFTGNPKLASAYAMRRGGEGGNVIPAFLSMQKPLSLEEFLWSSGETVESALTGREYRLSDLFDEDPEGVIRYAKESGADGVLWKNGDDVFAVAFEPTQIKSATGNNGQFDPNNPDIAFSRKQYEEQFSDLPKDVQDMALAKGFASPPTIRERLDSIKPRLKERIVQGVFDRFRSVKDFSPKAYLMLRMAGGSMDGAVSTLLHYGQVFNDDGALNVKKGTKGLLEALEPVGPEVDRFLLWVAANRAEQLSKQERERFFSPEQIKALKRINLGTTKGGKSRPAIYAEALRQMNELNRSVLDVARQTGLIDDAAYKRFSSDIWYVPFYRQMEEDGSLSGAQTSSGAVGQYLSKTLKGSERPLNDLMENVILNWSHILSASMRNAAAVETLTAASQMGGVVTKVTPLDSERGKTPSGEVVRLKGTVKVMEGGKEMRYRVDDDLVLAALSAVSSIPQYGFLTTLGRQFKTMLTRGVSLSPTFKINNLIRDSIQAIGLSELKSNPVTNVIQGLSSYKKDRVEALAAGGLFAMGNAYDGDQTSTIKRLLKAGVAEDTILSTPEKAAAAIRKLGDKYDEISDAMENANRLALYQQLRSKGVSHLEAAYAARDLQDFSLQGAWPAIRYAAMLLPYFNARLQGMYKLGRDGVVPTIQFLKGDTSQRQKAAKFSAVLGAVTSIGLLLYLSQRDDEEWKKREDWDRDSFFWIRVPGTNTALRIPKPFEMGAFASIIERLTEQMVDDGVEGKVFGKRLMSILSDNLAINPVPQIVRPLEELRRNKSGFTDRPIESEALRRLSPENRVGPSTSSVGVAMGTVNGMFANFVSGITGVNADSMKLSPIQYDYLVRGYLGWLGTAILTTSELAVSPFKEGEPPDRKLDQMFVVGSYLRELPSSQSKYVTNFYESAREISVAVADYKAFVAAQKMDEAKELWEDKKHLISMGKFYAKQSERLAGLNKQIKAITTDPKMSGDEKRLRIDRLEGIRNEIAKNAEVARIARKRESE